MGFLAKNICGPSHTRIFLHFLGNGKPIWLQTSSKWDGGSKTADFLKFRNRFQKHTFHLERGENNSIWFGRNTYILLLDATATAKKRWWLKGKKRKGDGRRRRRRKWHLKTALDFAKMTKKPHTKPSPSFDQVFLLTVSTKHVSWGWGGGQFMILCALCWVTLLLLLQGRRVIRALLFLSLIRWCGKSRYAGRYSTYRTSSMTFSYFLSILVPSL